VRRALATLAVAVSAAVSAVALPAHAEPVLADAVAVRFVSPDTGGAGRPRFLTARMLAFRARALARAEGASTAAAPFQERHVRVAIDQWMAIEILASLPLDPEPDPAALTRLSTSLREAIDDFVGGEGSLFAVARQEDIGELEVFVLLRREARAALYVERALGQTLHPTEDEVRDTFRSGGHPYKNRSYEDAHDLLERRMLLERLRTAQTAYLESARTRIQLFHASPTLATTPSPPR
jgi:hypothetical protein